MATHSSMLAWKIPWTEEPSWLQSTGSKKLDTTERALTHTQEVPTQVNFTFRLYYSTIKNVKLFNITKIFALKTSLLQSK